MEKFDVYDSNGRKTGQILDAVDQLQNEQYRMATTIWIVSGGKLLIQKRSKKLKTEPGKWAPTSGSSIKGECAVETALRECFEELGIELTFSSLKLVDKVFVGKYFINVFIAVHNDIDLNKLRIQKSEVEDVQLVYFDDIKRLMNEGKFFKNVVGWEKIKKEFEK